MDSFYDAPRRMQVFAPPEKVRPSTVVPEISVLCPQKETLNKFTPYTAWKIQEEQKMKENLPYLGNVNTNTSYLKKQVRFEGAQSKKCENRFEQIYLANIPNRNLDLSLVEPKKIEKKPETVEDVSNVRSDEGPKCYKDFKILRQNDDSVVDIFNYKKQKGIFETKKDDILEKEAPKNCDYNFFSGLKTNNYIPSEISTKILPQMVDSSTQTNAINTSNDNNSNNNPTISELLKIISQQNEQLLILQKQITTLLNKETSPVKQIEHFPVLNEQYGNQKILETPRKRLQKFTVDMMTSFEVSFRRQHQKNNIMNHNHHHIEPKIQEITETESNINKNNDNFEETSLHLKEPIKVRELCPSPEPSIKIDMNDYESSDDDDVSEIGATFYNNLMGQVNKILKKAHIETNRNDTADCSGNNNEKTLNKVKAATIKHLKSIGVNVDNIESTVEDMNCSKNSSEDSQISFAVKQLLMKYLPSEHLAKIKENDKNKCVIPNRPEFSFATVQYMKKYNLLSNANDGKNKLKNNNMPKILDISKLKQQPKLM